MGNVQDLLIIFSRYPVPGRTKTRLIPLLGAAGAASFHRLMAESIIARCRQAASSLDLSLEVHVEGGKEHQLKEWLREDLVLRRQDRGSLGKRMQEAFARGRPRQGRKVVLIGTDCPELTPMILEKAFARLDKVDLVLGPALDGGFYLIGLTRPADLLWQDVDWGSERVLAQILANAEKEQLSSILLEPLGDIDRPEDLARLLGQSGWAGVTRNRWF